VRNSILFLKFSFFALFFFFSKSKKTGELNLRGATVLSLSKFNRFEIVDEIEIGR
jgi:hypothetical protein